MPVATILNRKWRRACNEWKPAITAFEELKAGAGPVLNKQWKQEADTADENRKLRSDAMDIYDVPVTMRKLPVSSHPDVSRTYTNIGRSSPNPETDRNISNRDKFKISGAQARRPGLGSRWLST